MNRHGVFQFPPSGLAGDVAAPQLGGHFEDGPDYRSPFKLGQTPCSVGGMGDTFDVDGHTASVVFTTLSISPANSARV